MWLLVSAFAAGGSSLSPIFAPESRVPNDNTLRGLVVRNVAGSALLHLLTAVRGPERSFLAEKSMSI
jgi:hypothetical protein